MKGQEDGDLLSKQKVYYHKISKPFIVTNAVIFLLSMIFGAIYNFVWIGLFITGTSMTISTLFLNTKYWNYRGAPYKINLTLLFISVLLILPFSAIIPYLNGVSWFPVTALFTISLFVFVAGLILYFGEREIKNIWISVAGLFVLIISFISFNIETPDKKFVIRMMGDGAEIIGYRSTDEHVVIPKK